MPDRDPKPQTPLEKAQQLSRELQAHIDAALKGNPTMDKRLGDWIIKRLEEDAVLFEQISKRKDAGAAKKAAYAELARTARRQILVMSGSKMKFRDLPPKN